MEAKGGTVSCELDRVVEVMRRAHGLDVSRFDESFLTRSLEKRLAAGPSGTVASYLDRLSGDRAEAETLFHSLRIGYSVFFRDPLTFAVLEQLVLPGLVRTGRRAGRTEIRVWSAGCAAGQEAYSVAILLDELATGERPVSTRVIATDVSEADLAVARQGEYDATALQNVPLKHIKARFSHHDGVYRIVPRIQERVDFSAYDLLDERRTCPPASIFGDFDLILCCNVLLYYRREARHWILSKLRGCLAPNGYLVTGETERELRRDAGGFRAVAPPVAVFRKAQRNGGDR